MDAISNILLFSITVILLVKEYLGVISVADIWQSIKGFISLFAEITFEISRILAGLKSP